MDASNLSARVDTGKGLAVHHEPSGCDGVDGIFKQGSDAALGPMGVKQNLGDVQNEAVVTARSKAATTTAEATLMKQQVAASSINTDPTYQCLAARGKVAQETARQQALELLIQALDRYKQAEARTPNGSLLPQPPADGSAAKASPAPKAAAPGCGGRRVAASPATPAAKRHRAAETEEQAQRRGDPPSNRQLLVEAKAGIRRCKAEPDAELSTQPQAATATADAHGRVSEEQLYIGTATMDGKTYGLVVDRAAGTVTLDGQEIIQRLSWTSDGAKVVIADGETMLSETILDGSETATDTIEGRIVKVQMHDLQQLGLVFSFVLTKQMKASQDAEQTARLAKLDEMTQHRRRLDHATPCFSATGVYLRDTQTVALQKMGVIVLSDWSPAITHLVAKTFRRTSKMLCAICHGAHIVNPQYITECRKRGELVDHLKFTLRDDICEQAFAQKRGMPNYSLAEALAMRQKNGPMLKGVLVHCLPSVAERVELASLVVAAGGHWLADFPQDPDDPSVLLLGARAFCHKRELERRRSHKVYDVELLREAACTQVLRRHAYRLR